MTRQELIADLLEDETAYCCYCGATKVRFSCCGENHFETFAQMSPDMQEMFLDDADD